MRPKRAWFDKDLSRCFLLTGERVIHFHSIPYEEKPISQIVLGRYWIQKEYPDHPEKVEIKTALKER